MRRNEVLEEIRTDAEVQPKNLLQTLKSYGPLLSLAIVVGGWIYHFGFVTAKFENQETRISILETSAQKADVQVEKDKLLQIEIDTLRSQNEALEKSLEELNHKLDSLMERR